MSFLGFSFLFGLLGIGIPIALHIFSKRRKVVHQWAATRFLREARPTWKKRALRLQDFLVLLCRIAAVALLALAFARPALQVPTPPGNAGEIVLIVDRSASTDLANGKRDHLAQQIDELFGRVLSALPENYPVRILLNGSATELQPLPGGDASRINSRANRESWIKALATIAPGGSTLNWATVIRMAAKQGEPTPPTKIIVIADISEYGWPSTDSDWAFLDGDNWTAPVHLFPVGQDHRFREIPNPGIDRLETDSWRVQAGNPVTFRATVTNRGGASAKSIQARWLLSENSDPIAESSIPPLEENAAHQFLFEHTFEEGRFTVRLQLEGDDANLADNELTRTIQAIDRLPIVHVTGNSDDARERFSSWALSTAAGSSSPRSEAEPGPRSSSFFALESVTPDQLSPGLLENSAALIWSSAMTEFVAEPQLSNQLREFVAAGGGLWFRLPPDLDTKTFNEVFFPHEFGISPAGVSHLTHPDEPVGFRPPERDSVAFGAFGDLQIRKYHHLLEPPPDAATVSARLEEGAPFLIERKLGRGKVILTTASAHPDFGNLASCVGYVPLIRETLKDLTSPAADQGPDREPNEFITRSISHSYLDRLNRKPNTEVDYRLSPQTLRDSFVQDNEPTATRLEERDIHAWLLLALIVFLLFEVILAHQILSQRRRAMKKVPQV